EAGAGGDVQDTRVRAGRHRANHRPPPARILAEAEQRPEGVVAGAEAGEQLERPALTRGSLRGGDGGANLSPTGVRPLPLAARIQSGRIDAKRGEVMATKDSTQAQQSDGAV